MLNFKDGLFDLTKEQKSLIQMMYNGKVIKCLVAPYHSFAELEKLIPYTKSTLLFPERDMTLQQIRSLISLIAENQSTDDFIIITKNQNIILDMVDAGVRILTECGDIVNSPVKTFAANIHDIRYSILENKEHQLSKEQRNKSNDKIQILIDKLNKYKRQTIDFDEYELLKNEIQLIGEPIIRKSLYNMLLDINY